VQWRLVKNITLTNVADVSAIAYVPKTKTFWTCHNNNNGRLTEWTLDGANVRILNWAASQIADAEEVRYLGDDRYAIVDEDANRIVIFSITNNASGSTLNTNDATIVQLHSSIGVDGATASGVEGFDYDLERVGWWIAREKGPAQFLFIDANGNTNNWLTTAQMQALTNSTHTDFSALKYIPEDQIILFGQDEGGTQTDRVIALSLVTSNVLFEIGVTNFGQLEGVDYIGDGGKILVSGEVNQFAIFEPVLGGLNSGISWIKNTQTNLPDTVYFPLGARVGSGAQLDSGATYKTNALAVAGITATITNGDCWIGMLSNRLHAVCMSNNAVTFRVLAPLP
jgi:uncharacterized protein YjiK